MHFPNEEACKKHLKAFREKHGIVCSRCGCVHHYRKGYRNQWEYKVTDLRKWIALYNKNAREEAGGQMDIFACTPLTKEEILTDINETLRNATT